MANWYACGQVTGNKELINVSLMQNFWLAIGITILGFETTDYFFYLLGFTVQG